MARETSILDQNASKTGQALTILLLITAFVLDLWPLVTFVALAQLLGALALPFAPYRLFYQNVVRPSGLVKPNLQPDNPEPHRFALFVGAVFNFAATFFLLNDNATVGWVLVWVVIVLANLNFWLDFCLGCWFYYQFNRLGIPGFNKSPIRQ